MKKKMISLLAMSALLANISAYAADLSEEELQEQTRLMQEGEGFGATLKQSARGARTGVKWGARAGAVVGVVGGAATASTPVGGDTTYVIGAVQEALPVTVGVGGAVVGAAVGAGAGAAVGGALGAAKVAISTALRAGLRMWQIRKINNVLQERTTLNSFATLPRGQAMLFVAAYKRNIPVMKRLIGRLSDFVNQEGVWKALTELFFNEKPTSARVQRLQKLIAE